MPLYLEIEAGNFKVDFPWLDDCYFSNPKLIFLFKV